MDDLSTCIARDNSHERIRQPQPRYLLFMCSSGIWTRVLKIQNIYTKKKTSVIDIETFITCKKNTLKTAFPILHITLPHSTSIFLKTAEEEKEEPEEVKRKKKR